MGFLGKFDDLDQSLRRRSDRREERFVQQNQRGIFWWFVLPLLPVLVVATVALILAVGIERKDRQVAARLAADGAVAEGTVTDVDVRIKGDLIFSDRVRVTFFSDDGRWWTTSVASRIPVKEGPVAVRYLRSDPTVARLAADTEPGKGRPAAVLGFAVVVIVVYGLVLLLLHRHVVAEGAGEA